MKKVFIPVKYKKLLTKKFMHEINKKICHKVGLFTTTQFTNQLNQLKEFLENEGKEIFVGISNYKAIEKGQVLGCDIESPLSISEKVDCFVYLGTGYFHSILVSIETNKQVFQANPVAEFIKEIDETEIERYKILKKSTISNAKKAKKLGILVCTKFGQENLELAKKIRAELIKNGKKSYIFLFETLNPEELLNFPDIEAWINTACPRISIDDIERFDKPIVNWEDMHG